MPPFKTYLVTVRGSPNHKTIQTNKGLEFAERLAKDIWGEGCFVQYTAID